MFTWNVFMQDSNSPLTDFLYNFHDSAMIILTLITSMILYLMSNILMNNLTNRFLLQGHLIEIIWTIMPILILTFLAFPSLKTLYFIDEPWNPMFMTIKAIGNQWFWSYEYSDFKNIQFDSYMINEGQMLFRLLDVDNRLILPILMPMRILTTSLDVIHSWAMPSMGIKIDATPGRINQGNLFTMNPGLYFGQCSEICGANHSFMPIVLESTTPLFFNKWLNSF